MQTPPFEAAITDLLQSASQQTIALMCAEAVPWRCHRSLIADALVVRGIEVIDIYDLTHAKQHALSRMALVAGTSITYPAAPPPV